MAKIKYGYIFISDGELHALLYLTVPFLFLWNTLWVFSHEKFPWAFSIPGCHDTQRVEMQNMFVKDDDFYKLLVHY